METLARHSGEVEAVVAVREGGLSEPYDFLQIAQLYQDAGLPKKALAWAENGIKAFPDKTRPSPPILFDRSIIINAAIIRKCLDWYGRYLPSFLA